MPELDDGEAEESKKRQESRTNQKSMDFEIRQDNIVTGNNYGKGMGVIISRFWDMLNPRNLWFLTDEDEHQLVDMIIWNSQEKYKRQEEKVVNNIGPLEYIQVAKITSMVQTQRKVLDSYHHL